MKLGILCLLIWYLPAQPVSDDARDYQQCTARCNQKLVECYWKKPKNDPGTKCDDQWSDCNVKCRSKN